MKDLLVFAHRAEGQAFLRRGHWKPFPGLSERLFEHDSYWLLVAGEGLDEALYATSLVLGLCASSVGRVVSLGTAGGLRRGLEIGQVVSVRSVYRQKFGKSMHYHSITSVDADARLDVVSALDRVVSRNDAQDLEPFGALVDREAWAVGFAAQKSDRPFLAYKVVSDLPQNGASCALLKEHASELSEKLWLHWHQVQSAAMRSGSDDPRDFSIPEGFHLTVSQRQRAEKLFGDLRLMGKDDAGIWQDLDLEQIRTMAQQPKERGRILMAALANLREPELAEVRRRLQDLTGPWVRSGGSVSFSDGFETDEVVLRARIGSDRELARLQEALNAFPYAEIRGVLGGEG